MFLNSPEATCLAITCLQILFWRLTPSLLSILHSLCTRERALDMLMLALQLGIVTSLSQLASHMLIKDGITLADLGHWLTRRYKLPGSGQARAGSSGHIMAFNSTCCCQRWPYMIPSLWGKQAFTKHKAMMCRGSAKASAAQHHACMHHQPRSGGSSAYNGIAHSEFAR